jgi:ABC-type multidrug transport system fused ATPase/permease subunit
VTTIRKVLDLLTPRERRQAILLVPLVVVMALAEVAGIASIAPFLSLVADPETARTNDVLAWAYRTFGFESDRSFLIAVGVAVMIALLGANALLAGGFWILYRFGALRTHTISRRLLIRYLQQPYAFFLEHNSAALSNNILQEVQQIVNGTIVPGLHLIAKSLSVVTILILLIVVDPWIALLVAVVLGGAYGLLLVATRGYLKRISRERVKANQARYKAANEAMGGIKDVRMLGREGEMVRRYAIPSRLFAGFQANQRILGALPRYALEGVAFGSIVAIVLVLLAGGRTVSDLIPILGLFAFAGYRLLPALQQVFSSATQIRYSSGALDEVHQVVCRVDATKADPDAFVDPDAVEPLPFEERIRFERVSFAYAASEPVIRDVSLEIPVRTSVAFVGRTGAGKTTMVDLLLGLLTPTAGRITVDGVELTEGVLPRWRRRVGYVPQAIFLTDDTLTRNIALGVPDEAIDVDAVRRAARMAQLDGFVDRQLPHGYETIVGERGVRLSGGQRQRVGVARALYHDPDVLVFDEATSALDGATEKAVYETIEALSGHKTIVTIAHRLATIRNADTIFVMEDGRLVGQGRYDDLAATVPAFREIAVANEEDVAERSEDAHRAR